MTDLIITNGDAAGDLLAAAGLAGTILPWRDVLHEGPIVPAATLEELSEIRAAFLALRFHLHFADIRAEFAARDAILRQHGRFDRVEIWLEHDLYDQLQLLQIMTYFANEERRDGLVLVQADDFLGAQAADTILHFADRASIISRPMLENAAQCWAELCADTPWPALRRQRGAPPFFPFLGLALRRFIEELPDTRSGLSRSEAAVLTGIAEYRVTPASLFRVALHGEEAAFMGDWSFFRLLEDLAFASEPLVAGLPGRFDPFAAVEAREAYLGATLELTPFGQAVLAGNEDHVRSNGVDRWWAGTRLLGTEIWRFDRTAGSLIAPPDLPGD